ncbi:MAG: AAA family ATPase [Raineya sp.]|jgi:AAA15 family ATPase/GTPase|nr:AAA family ATPase [Raineya sp.]
MVKKIHIQNFKSIVDLELELGNLNVFIGENGAGKTNILEAILFGGNLNHENIAFRGLRVNENIYIKSLFNTEKTKEIKCSFINEKKQRIDFLEKYSRFIQKGYDEHNKEIFMIENPNFLTFSSGKHLSDAISITSYLQAFVLYAPENYFLRRFEEEGQIRPLGVRGEGLFKHLVDIYKQRPELLTKISENLRLISWFKDFEIPNDLMFTERRINIKDKYLEELDFFDQKSANEGFLYLLFYFTLFISPFTPPFFAIDNIDNALNPKLCAELIKRLAVLAKENNKQVLLTTHNPAVLDGLDLDDENQKLFTVYRNQEGHTKVKNIKPLKKVEGVEPVRLSEAFIRGYLGGLPKNF